MKFPSIPRLAVVLLLAGSLQGQQIASQLRDEVTRLQSQAAESPDSDTKTGLLKALKRTDLALTAGRDYLALEELATAHIMAQVLKDEQLRLDKATGVQKFEEAFLRARPEMLAADQRARGRTWKNVPEAVRAIAEISQGKTLVLMEATKPYAAATGPESGMLYIGQARATVQTSDFAAALKATTQARAKLRSILPELHKLQQRVNAAFKPPRSIERHTDFIRLNSSLKMAFELDAARLYSGAMYRYLEAERLLGVIEAPESTLVPDGTRGLFAKYRRQLPNRKRDDTLAELFLQKAEAFAAGREGGPPTADDWKNVAVILERVLPAYFAAQTSTPARLAATGKTITVTLVRWPYT